MLLTGQCKKDFNHWRFEIKKYNRGYVPEYNDLVVNTLIMQWFRSIGYIGDPQPWPYYEVDHPTDITEDHPIDKVIWFMHGWVVSKEKVPQMITDEINDVEFDSFEAVQEALIKLFNTHYNDSRTIEKSI